MPIQKLNYLQKCRKGSAKTRTVSGIINAVISGDRFLTAPNNEEVKVAYITINKTFNRNGFRANLFPPFVHYKMITV